VIGAPREVRRHASVLAVAALASLALDGGVAAQDASPVASIAPAMSPTASSAPAASAAVIGVTLDDFSLTPADISVTGTSVSFDVTNVGPTLHNLTIRDEAGTVLGATADLSQGQEQTLTLTLPAPGTYITYCSLPGHESLGLKGTLTVTEAGVAIPSGMASPAASPMS
jgi:plastocyanin